MTNEELKHALALVASQNAKLLSKPKRDAWDKISLFAPLITGLVITCTGLWITHRFDQIQKESDGRKQAADALVAQREREWQNRLSRTELLNKFMPYLTGTDQQSSMAIVAISITGDADLMDAVSKMVPSKGVKEGLTQVAAKGPTEEIRNKASTTLNLLETMNRAPEIPDSERSLRLRALKVALGELRRGVKEDPPGSNRGPDVDKYNRFAGVPDGTAWSGSFIYWCYAQAAGDPAKMPVKLGAAFKMVQQRLVESKRWHPKESDYKPQSGDLAIFELSPNNLHGGIVVNADDAWVYTVEGNTTPSNDSSQAEAVAGKAQPYSLVKGYGDMNF
jgi:hypothetical protein